MGKSNDLPPFEHITIKVTVSDIIIDFLYDPDSQYGIIPKEIYDKLNFRPPLIPIEKSGIGVDGHKFSLLGMAY